jgi:hypothetical protein
VNAGGVLNTCKSCAKGEQSLSKAADG